MRKFIGVLLSVSVVLSFLLASCSSGDTTTTAASSTTQTTKTTQTTATQGGTTTTATQANWWDELGTPSYGGEIVQRRDDLSGVTFDPFKPFSSSHNYQLENLFCPDWTVDRDVFAFKTGCIPELDLYSGLLAESWEMTDPLTFTVNLRQNVHWQDKAPTNGRAFTADDVVYSYDRALGTGSGFTQGNMFWAPAFSNVEDVVKVDDYTVQFKFNTAAAMSQFQVMAAAVPTAYTMVAKEWIELGSEGIEDWTNATGTGPWVLTDFVRGTSMTFEKNPNYYLYDERYPENQLPYVDSFVELAIPDESTTMAAIRTGKIDVWCEPYSKTWQQAKLLSESNPDDIGIAWLGSTARAIDIRCNQEPFDDINVRIALQMAIDIPTIAQSYYGGYVEPNPCGVVSPAFTGWVTQYADWSDDLKAEYAYNPEKAKQLLADAGYPDGFSCNCVATNSAVDLLEIMKAEFAEIGVEMSIEIMDRVPASQYAASGQTELYWGQYGYPFAINKVLLNMYSTETQSNYSSNNDSVYDNLTDEFFKAATLEEARELFNQADDRSIEQHWKVVVCPTRVPIFYTLRIKGYSGEIINGGSWLGFDQARWWVED